MEEKLKKALTVEGAMEILVPFIEHVSYVSLADNENPCELTIEDLKMDSLDTLELFTKVEEAFASPLEYIFGNEEKEWRAIRTVGDMAQKLSEFATKKLESDRMMMSSDNIKTQIDSFLERVSKRNVYAEALIKDFGGAARLKKWAEKHFGFAFSPEDQAAKIKTVGDFHQIVVKYYDFMKKI